MQSIHRKTKLGETLDQTLDEMINKNMITNSNKDEVLKYFDKVMLQIFKTVKLKLNCKATLKNYRHCDNVWNFMLKNVNIEDKNIKLMNIVAMDYNKIANIDGQDKPKNVASKSNNKKKKNR